MNSNFLFTLIVIGCMLVGCSEPYQDKEYKVRMINKLQSCEEENLYYTIVEVIGNTLDLKAFDSIVLPELTKNIRLPENYEALWPC